MLFNISDFSLLLKKVSHRIMRSYERKLS